MNERGNDELANRLTCFLCAIPLSTIALDMRIVLRSLPAGDALDLP